ncbi:MAG: DUF2892 domain-containing protein [Pyrinomonadaceae bacterium]|jgi:uncharacterized membrane protein|nr:DUF2892 domain-containing protein [Pyrinomonadaceae bacterium]
MNSPAEFFPDTESQPDNKENLINVGSPERWAFAIGGGALAVYGLSRRSPGGLLLSVLGTGMFYRGATGHCNVFQALGVSTATSREGESRSAMVGTSTWKSLSR